MAEVVICHNFGASGSSGTASSYNTEEICPEPNRLVLVAITNRKASTPDIPTLSGCGLTWTQLQTVVFDTGATDRRLTVFQGIAASPTAGQITVSFGGASQTGCCWNVLETAYNDSASPVVQSVVASGSGTTGTVNLAAFGNANNATVGFFSHSAQESTTAGTGFTRVNNLAFIGQGVASEFRFDNDTSVTATWSTSSLWGGVAVEVKAGTAPTKPTSLPTVLGDSSGSVIYVSPTGNDTTGDGSTGNPYASVNKALTVATRTSTIRLKYAGGSAHLSTAGERLTIQQNGSSKTDPITIETDPADSPNKALFTGEIMVGGTSNRIYGNYRFRNLEITKKTAMDNAASAAGDYGLRLEGARNIEISGCNIHDNNQGGVLVTGSVAFERSENVQIFNNRIHDTGSSGANHNAAENHDHAIYWGGESTAGVYGGAIYNNLLYGCYHGFTLHMWGGSSGSQPTTRHSIAAYNTCYDTATTGANSVAIMGGSGTQGAIENVITSNIFKKSGAGVRYAMEWNGANGTGNDIKFNLPHEIGDASLWDGGGSTHWTLASNLTSQDPGFADPVNDDFSITSASPAYDAGESAFLPSTDFNGTTRTTSEIGALAVAASSSSGRKRTSRGMSRHIEFGTGG